MRVKLTDFINFFSTEIVNLEQCINLLTRDIQYSERKYKDIDITKDISEYENLGIKILENIRTILHSDHSNRSDSDVIKLCETLAAQYQAYQNIESCITKFHEYESNKKHIEEAKMRLDSQIKESQRILKMREINEYLNAVPGEILEEYFTRMTS
jgi:hypothetical protein